MLPFVIFPYSCSRCKFRKYLLVFGNLFLMAVSTTYLPSERDAVYFERLIPAYVKFNTGMLQNPFIV